MSSQSKPLRWVGSSKKDLLAMPDDVIDVFGFALHLAQTGKKHVQSKPLKGFSGTSVLEVVEDHMGDTYRAVYTVKIADTVYVLHCFQKKSKQGIETPKQDVDLIRERLKAARAHAIGAGND
jgi:phage-related protein